MKLSLQPIPMFSFCAFPPRGNQQFIIALVIGVHVPLLTESDSELRRGVWPRISSTKLLQQTFTVIIIINCLPSSQSFFFSIGETLSSLSPCDLLQVGFILGLIEKLRPKQSAYFIPLATTFGSGMSNFFFYLIQFDF